MAPPIAVIDFETTGMAPAQGARATEVAIVLMEGEQVVDRFDSLMRTGVPIPPFIEQLTGISNAILATAPPAEAVMREHGIAATIPEREDQITHRRKRSGRRQHQYRAHRQRERT